MNTRKTAYALALLLLVTLVVAQYVISDLQMQIALNERDLHYAGEVISQQIPQCPEDAVLVGYGQFENGKWFGYKCGPALDDFGGHYE